MGVHDLFLALFPEEAQHEYWAKDRTLSASSFAPNGKIEPAKGGYTLSGKWSFCSGVDHAHWLSLGAFAGMLSTDPPIPDIRYLLLPRSECSGDRRLARDGAAGHRQQERRGRRRVRARAPHGQERSISSTARRRAAGVHDGPLYRAPVWAIFPFCISSPANGMARGAFDAYVEEMKGRQSAFDHSALAKKPNIQMRLAEAGALIDAGDLLYTRSLTETIDSIDGGQDALARAPAAQSAATRAIPW